MESMCRPKTPAFCPVGVDPYETVTWEIRDARVDDETGRVIHEQKGVEFPVPWSQQATNITASKYFRENNGVRESSVRQLVGRIASTAARWGLEDGYFTEGADRVFQDDLAWLMVHQYGCFNSPVLFNIGVEGEQPQASACFILNVEDTLESIMTWVRDEAFIFKYGSGAGANLSKVRGAREALSNGGKASGPVSFMKVADAGAGTVKSGGKNRRAAKLVCLDDDHPDLMEFIQCKAIEEKKAHALIDAGYDGGFNVPGGAYDSVKFQNANHSVRVSDRFMRAVQKDGDWTLKNRNDGKTQKLKAKDIYRAIGEAAWFCGDPGIQFHDTINAWHTIPAAGPIRGSNPCGEHCNIDNSACNLASLNLVPFLDEEGDFNADAFRDAIDVFLTAMDIWVDRAHYPTAEITENARKYRHLGLGYANLGALLMRWGVPYDSEKGRFYAACLTALMTFEAYAQSSRLAAVKGPYFEFESKHRKPHKKVLKKHMEALADLADSPFADDTLGEILLSYAVATAAEAEDLFDKHGIRNCQITLLAPTGTIAFVMDCDTTGVEPDIALVKYKKLVGGGMMKIVNQMVPSALAQLGYDAAQVGAITHYVNQHDTIEGAPGLKEEHLPVFDCAFKAENGIRFIHHMGHVRMLASVQPFLSSAISKTTNMPNSSTVDDILNTYMEAWKLGLKSITIYRDGCKRTQPLATSRDTAGSGVRERVIQRRRLPDERKSLTHKFKVGEHKGYVTVGLYEDGTPGELFLTISKEGSTVSGMMDAFATSISLNLQYGVPMGDLVKKFSHVRFEPSGWTGNPEIPMAQSILDYIFRWMELRFVKKNGHVEGYPVPEVSAQTAPTTLLATDAPPCAECGSLMVRNGSCHRCPNCGGTSGCS